MAEITLSNADNGKTLKLKPGQSIMLQLSEKPTTGYCWSISPFNEQILNLTDDRFELPKSSATGSAMGPVMGRGGKRIFTFKATRSGQVNLNLNQKRSWENSASGIESFNLILEVRE